MPWIQYLNINGNVTWAAAAAIAVSLASLGISLFSFGISYLAYKLNKNQTIEKAKLEIHTSQASLSGPICITINVINVGKPSLTLQSLGVARHRKDTMLIETKWEGSRPSLPKRLEQGQSASAIYSAQDATFNPIIRECKFVKASFASGQSITKRCKLFQGL